VETFAPELVLDAYHAKFVALVEHACRCLLKSNPEAELVVPAEVSSKL
jgi:hypothetical protein